MSDEEQRKPEVEVEWHRAYEFAAYAEAVGVPTDHVVAVRPYTETVIVLYTPDLEEPTVYAQRLGRDADGILVRMGEPYALGRFPLPFPPEEPEQ